MIAGQKLAALAPSEHTLHQPSGGKVHEARLCLPYDTPLALVHMDALMHLEKNCTQRKFPEASSLAFYCSLKKMICHQEMELL